MVEKNEISFPTNNLDTWTSGALSNMKRMSTDETYRQHIALLVRGDAEAWEIRQTKQTTKPTPDRFYPH